MTLKQVFYETATLLILAVASALIVNHFSARGIALLGEWDPSRGVVTAKAKNAPVFHEFEISDTEKARLIYDAGDAVFVDARGSDAFAQGHIRGAVSLPLGEAPAQIERFKKDFPSGTYLIAYCSGRECEDSHRLAQILLENGYENVSIFIDGYPGWISKGYPIE